MFVQVGYPTGSDASDALDSRAATNAERRVRHSAFKLPLRFGCETEEPASAMGSRRAPTAPKQSHISVYPIRKIIVDCWGRTVYDSAAGRDCGGTLPNRRLPRADLRTDPWEDLQR